MKGETISKEKLTSDEILNYRANKLETIKNEFKNSNVTLVEDEEAIEMRLSRAEEELSFAPQFDTLL